MPIPIESPHSGSCAAGPVWPGAPRPNVEDSLADSGNGLRQRNGSPAEAKAPAASQGSSRGPRRLVPLADGESSDVAQVLAEYRGADVRGKHLHEDLQRLAVEQRGRWVAGEWLGPLGWVRFLWCRK